MSGMTSATFPSPFAEEATLHDVSGNVVPLSRPGLTAGPPSPAAGGRNRPSRKSQKHV